MAGFCLGEKMTLEFQPALFGSFMFFSLRFTYRNGALQQTIGYFSREEWENQGGE